MLVYVLVSALHVLRSFGVRLDVALDVRVVAVVPIGCVGSGFRVRVSAKVRVRAKVKVRVRVKVSVRVRR